MGIANRQAEVEPPEGERWLTIADVHQLVTEAQALSIDGDSLVIAKLGTGGRVKRMTVRGPISPPPPPTEAEQWEALAYPPPPELAAGGGDEQWPGQAPPELARLAEGGDPDVRHDTVVGEPTLPAIPPPAQLEPAGPRHRRT